MLDGEQRTRKYRISVLPTPVLMAIVNRECVKNVHFQASLHLLNQKLLGAGSLRPGMPCLTSPPGDAATYSGMKSSTPKPLVVEN